MLRFLSLLPCLVALVTCRTIFSPYNVNVRVNPYHQISHRYVNTPLVNTGYQPTRYIYNNWRQPIGNAWSFQQRNNQWISPQFISDLEGRNEQLVSDLRSNEEQRLSDLRSQQEQLISDLGGNNGFRLVPNQFISGGW